MKTVFVAGKCNFFYIKKYNEKLASWPEILQIFDKTRFVAGKIQILMKTWLRGWKITDL